MDELPVSYSGCRLSLFLRTISGGSMVPVVLATLVYSLAGYIPVLAIFLYPAGLIDFRIGSSAVFGLGDYFSLYGTGRIHRIRRCL